jgi:4-alpha-glucanotransferase
MNRRASGILMHITSLPSPQGIGGLGPEAYAFADFLAETGQSVWQILPLTPTATWSHNDPYHSISAFAGNPLLISPELMVRDGLLDEDDIIPTQAFPEHNVDFQAVTEYKARLFKKAFQRYQLVEDSCFALFREEHCAWLEDFALFSALKNKHGGAVWTDWPAELRDRDPEALSKAAEELSGELHMARFLQYVFGRQWNELKAYCHGKGIQLFGDLPIYVDFDSAEVWCNPHLFKLDENKQPIVVAGVPPDYFSATGQLWESPIYHWDRHRESGFDWWMRRIERNLGLVDFLRIDHFRGLVAYWEVPAGEETAMNGQWVEAPVKEFLDTLARRMPCMPIIAEDLGVITPDVREAMRAYDMPGMKILLFAFGGDMPANAYIPHNIEKHSVAYTGTHDNNPVKGWFDEEAGPEVKKQLGQYFGREVPRDELPWEMVRTVFLCRADLAIVPVQDLLGLDATARMNRPGNLRGNWHWRMLPGAITDQIKAKLKELTWISGRE